MLNLKKYFLICGFWYKKNKLDDKLIVLSDKLVRVIFK